MFNKKKFKKIGNKIVELELELMTIQTLYSSYCESVISLRNKVKEYKCIFSQRIEKLERRTCSDSDSIVRLSDKLGEKDKMIESLREEVGEVRAVVKEFLKISGYKAEMVRNENYMQAHSIKVTKIDNPSNKKI